MPSCSEKRPVIIEFFHSTETLCPVRRKCQMSRFRKCVTLLHMFACARNAYFLDIPSVGGSFSPFKDTITSERDDFGIRGTVEKLCFRRFFCLQHDRDAFFRFNAQLIFVGSPETTISKRRLYSSFRRSSRWNANLSSKPTSTNRL